MASWEQGLEVARCWIWLPERDPCVYLDEWVVMPNQLHGIVVPTDAACNNGGNAGETIR